MHSSTSSSEQADRTARRRLLWALGIGAGALLASVVLVARVAGDALVEAGHDALNPPRERLLRQASEPRRADRLVLFLGDSTLSKPPYPSWIDRWLRDVEVRSMWSAGLGPSEHYLLLGRALEQQPEGVVLLAHLRMFGAEYPLWEPSLLTALSPRELPRALALPFHDHGVGAARLVLASAWGVLGSETLFEAYVGGQELAASHPLLRWLTPPRRIVRDGSELPKRSRRRLIPLYGDRLYDDHPDVRILAASVEQATRRGARVLVLVTPVPVERFRERGSLELAGFPARVEVLRRAVERNGGELLDLHDALGTDEFSDALGHMNRDGAQRVARAVLPWLAQLVPEPEERKRGSLRLEQPDPALRRGQQDR